MYIFVVWCEFNILLPIMIRIIVRITGKQIHIKLAVRPINGRNVYMMKIVVLNTTSFASIIVRFTSISQIIFCSGALNSMASKNKKSSICEYAWKIKFTILHFVYFASNNNTFMAFQCTYANIYKTSICISDWYYPHQCILKAYLFKIQTTQIMMKANDIITPTTIIRMTTISASKRKSYWVMCKYGIARKSMLCCDTGIYEIIGWKSHLMLLWNLAFMLAPLQNSYKT